MTMRFLTDLCISWRVTESLRAEGHDVVDVSEEAGYGTPDLEILARAAREGRIVLTADLDFPRLLATHCVRLPSVIVFRLDDPSSAATLARLQPILKEQYIALAAGAVVTVEPRRVRVRLLPVGGET